jgi:hypothetical protein
VHTAIVRYNLHLILTIAEDSFDNVELLRCSIDGTTKTPTLRNWEIYTRLKKIASVGANR